MDIEGMQCPIHPLVPLTKLHQIVPEVGLEAWIGRRNNICDAGVTRTLMLTAARILT